MPLYTEFKFEHVFETQVPLFVTKKKLFPLLPLSSAGTIGKLIASSFDHFNFYSENIQCFYVACFCQFAAVLPV